MKDGFSESFEFGFKAGFAAAAAEQKKTAEITEKGFELGFKAGFAAAAAEQSKTTEITEKQKNCIDGKLRAKAWAIKQGIIKR